MLNLIYIHYNYKVEDVLQNPELWQNEDQIFFSIDKENEHKKAFLPNVYK